MSDPEAKRGRVEKPRSVRGMQDFLPERAAELQRVIAIAERCARLYGFERIETPILEHASLFRRSLGDLTDVVMKEMYSFTDKNGEELCLRPENTAGVVRALISNGLTQTLPQRWFYAGPMFRRERPQKGRYRQFHQCGVELLGQAGIEADIEVITCAWRFLQALCIEDKVQLKINWLGSIEERAEYSQTLRQYFKREDIFSSLSPESQTRVERNPLRVLDSKDPRDKKAIQESPKMFVPQEKMLLLRLILSFYNIDFDNEPSLVRGLDYYNDFVFEFVEKNAEREQSAVIAGGRYDRLCEELGGHAVPAVGWAAGLERLVDLHEAKKIKNHITICIVFDRDDFESIVKKAFKGREKGRERKSSEVDFLKNLRDAPPRSLYGHLFFIQLQKDMRRILFFLSECNVQISAICDTNFKKAMTRANKENASYVLRFFYDEEKKTDDEIMQVFLRNMETGKESSALTRDAIMEKLQKKEGEEYTQETLVANLESLIARGG